MLLRLRISNFAIIDALDLELKPGYTVITGETGSGKSILLNALSMLLGERADFTVIGRGGDKAVVEMECRLSLSFTESFFHEFDLDMEGDTAVVRREIHRSGKSRAFINDTPVNLSVLKAFSEQQIRIHSQYNTLDLKDPAYQLQLLDRMAELMPLVEEYTVKFHAWEKQLSRYSSLKNKWHLLQKQEDFNRFQLDELSALQLHKKDYHAIEKALEVLKNKDETVQLTEFLIHHIQSEQCIQSQLNEMLTQIDRKGTGNETLELLGQRLKSIAIEVQDVLQELFSERDRLTELLDDPKELESQLDAYNQLLRKHRCINQQGLLAIQTELEEGIEQASELEEQVWKSEKTATNMEEELNSLAIRLHQNREAAAVVLEQKLIALIRDLKLPDTSLSFSLKKTEELLETGKTTCMLMFSANKGFVPVPIEKAASGGELSRVMLAIQKLLADVKGLPSLLLDEIDTGVSGDVARKIGVFLSEMGKNTQLIAISHLPQVAALARHHFRVMKNADEEGTKVNVVSLDSDERILELARLISGEKVTQHAIEAAKELMG